MSAVAPPLPPRLYQSDERPALSMSQSTNKARMWPAVQAVRALHMQGLHDRRQASPPKPMPADDVAGGGGGGGEGRTDGYVDELRRESFRRYSEGARAASKPRRPMSAAILTTSTASPATHSHGEPSPVTDAPFGHGVGTVMYSGNDNNMTMTSPFTSDSSLRRTDSALTNNDSRSMPSAEALQGRNNGPASITSGKTTVANNIYKGHGHSTLVAPNSRYYPAAGVHVQQHQHQYDSVTTGNHDYDPQKRLSGIDPASKATLPYRSGSTAARYLGSALLGSEFNGHSENQSAPTSALSNGSNLNRYVCFIKRIIQTCT